MKENKNECISQKTKYCMNRSNFLGLPQEIISLNRLATEKKKAQENHFALEMLTIQSLTVNTNNIKY